MNNFPPSPSSSCYVYQFIIFSSFVIQGALEQAERALRQATGTDNLVLECETYVIYGDVYLTLKDYDKAMKFYIRSSEMIRCLGQPWSPQLRATVLLKLANGNRKQRVLDRALQYCEVWLVLLFYV